MRLLDSLGVFAKRDDKIVHQEAVGAGDFVVSAYGLGKAAQDEKAISGKFAGVFSRRIVTRRKRVRQHFNESRLWLFFKAPQHFSFAGRDKAGNRDHAFSRFFDDAAYRFAVFFDGLFAREPYRKEEGRSEEREITDGVPCAIRRENRMANIGEPDEAVGVALFPERAGGVELDVAPECLKLARRKGKHKPEFRRPEGCAMRRGSAPNPVAEGEAAFGKGSAPNPVAEGKAALRKGFAPSPVAEGEAAFGKGGARGGNPVALEVKNSNAMRTAASPIRVSTNTPGTMSEVGMPSSVTRNTSRGFYREGTL